MGRADFQQKGQSMKRLLMLLVVLSPLSCIAVGCSPKGAANLPAVKGGPPPAAEGMEARLKAQKGEMKKSGAPPGAKPTS
jgi:hypothetical protein